MKNVGNSSRGRSQGVMNIFRAPYRRIALSSLRLHTFLVLIGFANSASLFPSRLFEFGLGFDF